VPHVLCVAQGTKLRDEAAARALAHALRSLALHRSAQEVFDDAKAALALDSSVRSADASRQRDAVVLFSSDASAVPLAGLGSSGPLAWPWERSRAAAWRRARAGFTPSSGSAPPARVGDIHLRPPFPVPAGVLPGGMFGGGGRAPPSCGAGRTRS
jgi:hypothetical protein